MIANDTQYNPRNALLMAALQRAKGNQADSRQSGQFAGYVDPGQREAQLRASGGNVGASANDYATKRLQQFAQIASNVGGEFQDMFRQGVPGGDAAGQYRRASGLFSQYAQQKGIADPRMLLQSLLAGDHTQQAAIQAAPHGNGVAHIDSGNTNPIPSGRMGDYMRDGTEQGYVPGYGPPTPHRGPAAIALLRALMNDRAR